MAVLPIAAPARPRARYLEPSPRRTLPSPVAEALPLALLVVGSLKLAFWRYQQSPVARLEDSQVDILPRILLEVVHQGIHASDQIPDVAIERGIGEKAARGAFSGVQLPEGDVQLS